MANSTLNDAHSLSHTKIENKTLDSLKKDKNITMLTPEKLCTIIGCTPNDISVQPDEAPS